MTMANVGQHWPILLCWPTLADGHCCPLSVVWQKKSANIGQRILYMHMSDRPTLASIFVLLLEALANIGWYWQMFASTGQHNYTGQHWRTLLSFKCGLTKEISQYWPILCLIGQHWPAYLSFYWKHWPTLDDTDKCSPALANIIILANIGGHCCPSSVVWQKKSANIGQYYVWSANIGQHICPFTGSIGQHWMILTNVRQHWPT